LPVPPKGSKLLVIGSGPIVIGQAAEFDYAGTQACTSLREEGYEVVLVNSNPATIMTDPHIADRVYIEPLTVASVTAILERERPAGLLATLGGQTALNLACALAEAGVLERLGVHLLGTPLASIQQAEDRQLFKDLMQQLAQPVPESMIVTTLAEGMDFLQQIGLPLIVRPAYTLGGTGGGIAETLADFRDILARGLKQSPISQVLVERSIRGFKEIEYEVMRDGRDTCLTICNMENVDPVGVHTGDSIVVAPSQTLTDRDYQRLRTAALTIIRALQIEGGCNVQFALDPQSDRYYVIEVNPRVSRSSALASKATGYPIAKIAAKIAVGRPLDELLNPVTGQTYAAFEPALDYVVVKIPRWPFDKFSQANRALGTQMKATGEVMALGRSFEEALQKALRSLEIGVDSVLLPSVAAWSEEQLLAYLRGLPDDRRLFVVADAIRRGYSCEELNKYTEVDVWFLEKLRRLVQTEVALADWDVEELSAEALHQLKQLGFTDRLLAARLQTTEDRIREKRSPCALRPAYTLVDTCAAEFEAATPYFFSTWRGEEEAPPGLPTKPRALVLGSGPIRIGQGIEFDYCSVHAVRALRALGYETLIVNNNPETVSTDFDTADRLYFEPLTVEDVRAVVDRERPEAVFVQFGGQTAINLAAPLAAAGVPVAGTTPAAIDAAEDREAFRQLLDELGIPQSAGGTAYDGAGALQIAHRVGYPVVVRPSYVIGGRAMAVVTDDDQLIRYMQQATAAGLGRPVLVDRYLAGREVEVDAISDGTSVLIPGIFEHIERAGVHSGDSCAVYPPQHLTAAEQALLVDFTARIAQKLPVVGLLNIQFVLVEGEVCVLEVNPRASRTVPILSKVTGVPMVELAVRVQCGQALAALGYGTGLYPETEEEVVVKAPVFSFGKLTGLDIALSPEMKSTGEVLGIASTYEAALAKAFLGADIPLPARGGVLVSLCAGSKSEALPTLQRIRQQGLTLYATTGTADWLNQQGLPCLPVARDEEAITACLRSGAIQLVLNSPTQGGDVHTLGYHLRRTAVELRIPCLTSLDTAAAWALALTADDRQPHLLQPHLVQPPPLQPVQKEVV